MAAESGVGVVGLGVTAYTPDFPNAPNECKRLAARKLTNTPKTPPTPYRPSSTQWNQLSTSPSREQLATPTKTCTVVRREGGSTNPLVHSQVASPADQRAEGGGVVRSRVQLRRAGKTAMRYQRQRPMASMLSMMAIREIASVNQICNQRDQKTTHKTKL